MHFVSSIRPIAGVKSSVSDIVCYSLKADSRSHVLRLLELLLCATPLRPIAGVQFLFPFFIEGRLPKKVVFLDFCDCKKLIAGWSASISNWAIPVEIEGGC